MTRVWQSGMTVSQGEIVTSPLDWEEYRRIAATGGGNLDPADDTTNYYGFSYRRTLAIPTRAAITSQGAGTQFATNIPATNPALVAGVRTLIFSATGRGVLGFCGIGASNAGTMKVEVLIDGRAVHDSSVTFGNGTVWLLVGKTVFGKVGSTEYPDYKGLVDSYSAEFRRNVSVYVTPETARNGTDRFVNLAIGQG